MHQQQQPVSATEATWAFARDVNDAAARVRVLQVLRRPGGDQVSPLCYLLFSWLCCCLQLITLDFVPCPFCSSAYAAEQSRWLTHGLYSSAMTCRVSVLMTSCAAAAVMLLLLCVPTAE